MSKASRLSTASLTLLGLRIPAAPQQGYPPSLNHLQGQKSPYLIQHVSNPVDWYPWGEEAFEKARAEGKLIFLSIGYSTCHWCHVMEDESFKDPAVAALMNRVFVSIKVDREERPDLDAHFMTVSQLLSGGGGWPLTIFMTPDARPFFSATYIPKDAAYGLLGMLELIPKIEEVWKLRRSEVLESVEAIAARIRAVASAPSGGFKGSADLLQAAADSLWRDFDPVKGGFGGAPKFPMATAFPLLLRSWSASRDPRDLSMVEQTLLAMRNGGIYDQLGYGFHRYATDAGWQVPHFEKMLYDQALLALAYIETWQATGRSFYRSTAEEVLTYVLRDLALPEGGFASAEDADSEGSEGSFYRWSDDGIRSVLGEPAAAAFLGRHGMAGEGILHRAALDENLPGDSEKLLLAARSTRTRPLRDDKLLADWNGLMIASLARAGAAFENQLYVSAAARAADFIVEKLRGAEGGLLHRYCDGEAAIPAFADDYAFLAWGMVELYEASFEARWLEAAIGLMEEFSDRLWDPVQGGYFQSQGEEGRGIGRIKTLNDGVTPSANSVALIVLLRLNRLTGRVEYERLAQTIMGLYPPDPASNAFSYGFFLSADVFSRGPSFEVVIAGDPEAADTRALLRGLSSNFFPNAVVILLPTNEADPAIVRLAPFTAFQGQMKEGATAYVCEDFACRLPTTDIGTMLSYLGLSGWP